MPFAIAINEKTQNASQTSDFTRYSSMIVFGTSTTDTTFRNVPTIVNDLADFTTKFGASSPSLPYFRFIFANDTTKQNSYYFVNSWVNAGTLLTNIQAGIAAYTALLDQPQSVLFCGEIAQSAIQADVTAVFTSLNTLAATQSHVLFYNLRSATNTKVLALAERTLYTSLTGNSAVYYEFYKDTLDVEIPVALHAAIIELVRSYTEDPFQPPAGASYPAQGIKGVRLNNLISTLVDFNDCQNNGINIVELIPRGKYCVTTSRTLAIDDRWLNINTRIAVTICRLRLIAATSIFLQTSSDPQGRRSREAERRCYDVMDYMYDNGALTADNIGDRKSSYKISITPVTSSSRRRFSIVIQAKFVDALESITIDLVNTTVIV